MPILEVDTSMILNASRLKCVATYVEPTMLTNSCAFRRVQF